ncbi:MAG: murein L,D-transpeptidase catalytic domain family protein [Elusimicrobiales bacterium]
MEFFPQIILSLNPSLDSVIIYYSSSSASKYSASIKYDVASAAEANRSLLEEALSYYQNHKDQFSNHRFMAVLEFNKHSAKSRFYIINLNKMAVIGAYHVAHGKGSDPDNDGYATYFSNQPGSEASSLGVYKTGDIYSAKWGVALRLHGLSPTNSNVYRRGIVIHPSLYVKEANVKPGRSFGCMAFDYKVSGDVINMLRGGGFIYAKYIR